MKSLLALTASVLSGSALAWSITTDAPGWTFTDEERPAFRLAEAPDVLHWELVNWRGRMVRVGDWQRKKCETCTLPRLSAGFYHLRLAGVGEATTNDVTFCVVPSRCGRKASSFFGTDSALSGCSWHGAYDCPWYGGDNPRVTTELMAKCGFAHTRERWVWGNWISPEREKRDFSRPLHSSKWLQKHGVKSLGLLGDAPAWLKKPGKDLPDDLMELYCFAKDIARVFAPYYDAWEYCNESELLIPHEPVWEYVAALKAFALGARAGAPETILLPTSFAGGIEPGGYAQAVFDGDAVKYTQALNFHSYVPLCKYEHLHRELREFMKANGLSERQIWLTESGTSSEGNGLVPSSRRGLKAHSPEQEMIVAEFYPKSCILHQQGGVARNYFFLFGCYNEQGGRRDWGTMRRDGTVKPVHAAMASISAELGNAKILGEKMIGEGLRVFVYVQPDGSETLAFWSQSELDTSSERVKMTDLKVCAFELVAGRGVYRLVDMMGTPSAVTNGTGKMMLTAERFPQYLTGLKGLSVDKAAMETGWLSIYEPKENEDLSVVIRPKVNPEDFEITGGKCMAELVKERGRVKLGIWNFSDEAKCGDIGCRGGSFGGAPVTVSLAPWGKTTVEVSYVPPEGDEIRFDLDIAGKFNGKRTSKVRVPVLYNWRFMRDCRSVELDELNDPSAWKRSDSAKEYACTWDDEEKSLLFELKWDDSTFPVLFPRADIRDAEAVKGSRYLEFEAKSWQDKVENDMGHMKVIFTGRDGGAKTNGFAPLGFSWEKRRVAIPKGMSVLRYIQIGFAPRGRHLKFWLRNLRLLKAKE